MSLTDSRESLTYWETRAQTLPRRAVRQRREAREMAARWRERVSEAERAQYGPGLLGALLMVVFERRLPVGARQTGHQLARVAASLAAVTALVLVAVLVAAGVIAIEILRALL